jgi:IS605 OrfB family transposase
VPKSAKPPKAPPLLSFEQRALTLARPSAALSQACLALGLQAKNLRNTAHFLVNNVLTAYDKVERVEPGTAGAAAGAAAHRLRPELHPHQRQALDAFNTVIERLNRARQTKYEAALAAGGEVAKKAKLTILPLFAEEVASPYRSALDITVLDNVLRDWPGLDGSPVYARLPAVCAQQVLLRYKASWSGFFEALKVFSAGGAAMTGRPRSPGYLAQEERFVVELPLVQLGANLVNLGQRTIPLDFAESVSLSEEELSAWNGYRIADAIARACAKRGFAAPQAQHLRIVPVGPGVKFEVVVRVARALPPDSLLAQLELQLGDELPASGAKRRSALLAAVQDRTDLRLAGIDFGVSNTAAIAYSTGHKAHVVSAGRLETVLGRMDAELDALVGALTDPALRALQARKEALQATNEKLSRADEMALRKGLKALYANQKYRDLRGQRERWLSDYLHKLSHGIVASATSRGVRALVLGQNKGWKDGMALGKTQNRRFGRIPLARLIELITYKAEAAGLVVLTTEESYTSQASFVNNEALRTIDPARQREGKKTKKTEAAAAASPPVPALAGTAPKPAPTPVVALGKRLKHERNTFVNLHQTGRWARVHADVNAAFNMLRKVFKGFAFHAGLTLKYTVLRLSPRLGLTPAQI